MLDALFPIFAALFFEKLLSSLFVPIQTTHIFELLISHHMCLYDPTEDFCNFPLNLMFLVFIQIPQNYFDDAFNGLFLLLMKPWLLPITDQLF